MTAFASNILAGLTGLGAKPGAGTTDAKSDVAGAFEALLAGLVANGQARLDAAEAVTVEAATPVQTASPMAAAVATAFAPVATMEETPATKLPAADVSKDVAPGDSALAGAEALVLPLPFAVDQTVAALAAEDAAAPAAASEPLASAPILADAPLSLPVSEEGADAPHRQAPAADAAGPRWNVSAGVLTTEAPTAAAFEQVARSDVDPASAEPVSGTAAAPVADAAEAATLAARAVAPELVSLVARLIEPARSARGETAPAAAPPEREGDIAAAEVAAEPLDVAVEVIAEAPAEAAEVAEAAVPAPVIEAPAPARRSSRAETARTADRIETLEPGLKAVARTDKAAPTDAPEAVEPDAVPAAPLVAEAPETADRPTLDTPVAAQGAAPQAHAVAADATAVVRGSPETVAKLASDIARKLEGQSTKFDIQLDPLGLGKVDVSIEINADGRLTAALTFDSAQAAADLRGRAAELRQALEKAGFDLTDASLSFDTGAQSGGFSGRDPGEPFAAWSSRAFHVVQAGLEQADVQLAAAYARTPSGGVDIRI